MRRASSIPVTSFRSSRSFPPGRSACVWPSSSCGCSSCGIGAGTLTCAPVTPPAHHPNRRRQSRSGTFERRATQVLEQEADLAMGISCGIVGACPALVAPQPPPAMTRPTEWHSVPGSIRRRWAMLPVLAMMVLLAWYGTAAHAASDSTAETVQRALLDRGFDPGEVDGAMGSRTRRALEAFQRSIGLSETGQADSATLEALGLKPSADAPKPEPPSAESDIMTSAGPSDDEPSQLDSAPERTAGTTLRFAQLGWHLPPDRHGGTGAFPRNRCAAGAQARVGFPVRAESRARVRAGSRRGGSGSRLRPRLGPAHRRVRVRAERSGHLHPCLRGGRTVRWASASRSRLAARWRCGESTGGDVQYPPATARITSQGLEFTR